MRTNLGVVSSETLFCTKWKSIHARVLHSNTFKKTARLITIFMHNMRENNAFLVE